MIADSRRRRPPPEVREGDDKVVCIERTETRLGVRWKEADGRMFESDKRTVWCSRSIHGANASLTRDFEGAAAQRMNRRMNSR